MKLKEEIIELKRWIVLILIAILSFWLVNNFEIIVRITKTVINVLFPFILGGVIAFVLNIPTTKIERFLTKHFADKPKFSKRMIRIIAICLSLLLLFAIVVFLAFLLIPELIENIQLLMKNIPKLMSNLEKWVIDLLDKYPEMQQQIEELFNKTDNTGDIISSVLNYFVNSAVGFVSNLVSGCVTIFTSLVFSIYMLSQKEYLIRGVKKIIYAYLDKKYADKLIEVGSLSNKTFSKFISGQCVEAVILGSIIFVVSLLFGFPYALVIAVMTAITALIPIFGAIIAMVVGAILIGINDPFQAFLFIVVFQVVQQIEGNFIYPKVVGKSVGLSPIWTLLSITVGGSLFGIVGMLIGLPLASIIYAIIKNNVNEKLMEKKIKI